MISSRVFLRSMRTSTSMMLFHRSLSFTSSHQSQTSTKLKEQTSNSSTPIPSPSSGLHDPKKIYSEKIQRLAEEISKLSLVDVMDLNELLKKTLKIQDVPIMASTGGTAAAAAPTTPKKKEEDEDEGARPQAQSVFKVRLIKFDETKKVPVIKQVKDVVENINLVQAKKLVESVPQVLRDNLSKADAEAMKAKVEAVGGVCVIE